jgi:hypothetical protein
MDPSKDVRARFAFQASYWVDGVQVEASNLRLRVMNFGQHWRTGPLLEVPYKVLLPLAWGVEVFERDWDGWVEDARRFPSEEPVESRLRGLGWPAPWDAVRHGDTARLLAESFAHDILLGWLGDASPVRSPGFVLNTIDEVTADAGAGVIVITGTARTHDPEFGYKYQDV